ncbi:MAG: large-conductance mechanosensitive channel protein MscL [Phycisphaerae bacterium]|nr:large-conductance mechanosensitive channel protein MscL [Phycisphaerae bacterium]
MLKEFKEFAFKGNMIDMAVGIIIGAAFGGLVKSLVDKVFMPPLGLLIGGLDFTDYKLQLKAAVLENGDIVKPAVEIGYGEFISVLINFLIVAFAVFLLIKGINTARKRFEAEEKAAPAPAGPTQEQLLAEIRDLLKSGR